MDKAGGSISRVYVVGRWKLLATCDCFVNLLLTLCPREATVPLLPLLAKIDSVQQVRAWASHARVAKRAKVWNRNALNGRFVQEQVADRRVRRLREILQLLQCGACLLPFPQRELRETTGEYSSFGPRTVRAPSVAILV